MLEPLALYRKKHWETTATVCCSLGSAVNRPDTCRVRRGLSSKAVFKAMTGQ